MDVVALLRSLECNCLPIIHPQTAVQNRLGGVFPSCKQQNCRGRYPADDSNTLWLALSDSDTARVRRIGHFPDQQQQTDCLPARSVQQQ